MPSASVPQHSVLIFPLLLLLLCANATPPPNGSTTHTVLFGGGEVGDSARPTQPSLDSLHTPSDGTVTGHTASQASLRLHPAPVTLDQLRASLARLAATSPGTAGSGSVNSALEPGLGRASPPPGVTSGVVHRVEVYIDSDKVAIEVPHGEEHSIPSVVSAFIARHRLPPSAQENLVTELERKVAMAARPPAALTRPSCLANSRFRDVLLVVIYSRPFYGSIPLLEAVYRRAFPNIVFATPFTPAELDDPAFAAGVEDRRTVKCVVDAPEGDIPEEIGGSAVFHECLAQVMEVMPQFKGYLLTHDDMVLNFWNLRQLDLRKMWAPRFDNTHNITQPGTRWWWSAERVGAPPAKRAYAALSDADRAALAVALSTPDTLIGGYADVFYVPARLRRRFVSLSHLFTRFGVWVEIAVPTIMAILSGADRHGGGLFEPKQPRDDGGSDDDIHGSNGDSDTALAAAAAAVAADPSAWPTYVDLQARNEASWELLEGLRLWENDRDELILWRDYYSPSVDYLHPVKLSRPLHVEGLLSRVLPEAQAWTTCTNADLRR